MNAVIVADVLAKSGEAAKSGPIGFAVILVFCVACYFLFKSMSKHLKKVREQFPDEQRPVDLKKDAVQHSAGDPPAPQ